MLKLSNHSANVIRKHWNNFKLRRNVNDRIEKRKVKVKVVTKRIFPGYLKSTAASRSMRKKEKLQVEDLSNELKLTVEEDESTPGVNEYEEGFDQGEGSLLNEISDLPTLFTLEKTEEGSLN